jgi:hypothetical protein
MLNYLYYGIQKNDKSYNFGRFENVYYHYTLFLDYKIIQVQSLHACSIHH